MRYFYGTASASASNTTAETPILPTGVGAASIPANILSPGREAKLFACGVYSCTALAPTVTVKIKLGSTVIAQAAVSTVASVATNLYWEAKLTIGVRSVNTGNTSCALMSLGMVSFISAAGTLAVATLANPAGVMTTVTVDNSSDLSLAITDTWNVASTSNSATVALIGLDIN